MSITIENRRSPYGERGLKLRTNHEYHHRESSLSLRRAWIEITSLAYNLGH